LKAWLHRWAATIAFLILAFGMTYSIARLQSNSNEHNKITQEVCDSQWYNYRRRVLLDHTLLRLAQDEMGEHPGSDALAHEVQHLIDTLAPPTCQQTKGTT
jgi:hypothetical protein